MGECMVQSSYGNLICTLIIKDSNLTVPQTDLSLKKKKKGHKSKTDFAFYQQSTIITLSGPLAANHDHERANSREHKYEVFPRTGRPNTIKTDILYCLVSLKAETSMSHENLLSLNGILIEEMHI